MRLPVMLLLGLVACGGRTDLGARGVPVDAGANEAPEAPRGFKVVYQSLLMPAPLVWHSSDASTTAFPFDTFGPCTYDGSRMVVATDAIHVLDATGALLRTQPFPLGAPAFVRPRPDGERLLVTSDAAGEVGTLDADGTYHAILGLDPTADAMYAPDGSTILGSGVEKGTGGSLFTMRDDGTDRKVLATNATGFDWPDFSADGAHVLYATEAHPNETSICVLDVATHTTTTVLDTKMWPTIFPQFTPDGTGIVFVEWEQNVASIRLVDVSTHEVTTLVADTGHGYGIDTGFVVAPD